MRLASVFVFLFFKQKTADEMRISDWSSDVCSSDLTFGSVPRAEAVKWHWFENVPARDSAERHQVPQLWFLYQACDLTRLAYEVILSAALTMIDAAPRRRMSLGELTDELADAVEIASGESWDDFSGGINAEAEVSSAQQYATAMLDAMNAGETAQQGQNAIHQLGRP